MPSRLGIVAILFFWCCVTGYVAYRDLYPRFFADTPPQIGIELVDELSSAATQWTIYRVDDTTGVATKIGAMTGRTEYVGADDTFRFITNYRGLKYDTFSISVEVPTGTVTIRTDREGRLREQSMLGKFDIQMQGQTVATAEADVTGIVQDGLLVGRAKLSIPGFFKEPFNEELKPVAVPEGRILNPMMPVDRLKGVVPGRRWTIRQTNPMEESLQALILAVLAKNNMNSKLLPQFNNDSELLAEVRSSPENLTREGKSVSCWVIHYESADKQRTAKTYVRRENGQVLRQEASGMGNRFVIDRNE
jgi:hypothetical protein